MTGTFKFEPNPQNPSENFETYLSMHHNIAISDVPKTDKLNEKFRCARADKNRNLPYTYTLSMLTAEQPSMVDNMNYKYEVGSSKRIFRITTGSAYESWFTTSNCKSNTFELQSCIICDSKDLNA